MREPTLGELLWRVMECPGDAAIVCTALRDAYHKGLRVGLAEPRYREFDAFNRFLDQEIGL